MGLIEERLAELGLELPAVRQPPPGIVYSYETVRVHAGLAYVAGHGPVDGARTLVSGRVGDAVSPEEAAEAARLTGLSILASIRETLGELDRVRGWVRVLGLVNCAPGFNAMPAVINGFSDLLLELWGDPGRHARSAIGVAELPFDWPVEIEATAELELGEGLPPAAT